MDTLTTVMNAFKTGFESGITNVTPAAQGLFLSLLTIDFIWAMCKAAMDPGANYIKILVEKSVRYGIFGFFITNYDKVFHQIIDSLIQVGLKAGGDTLTAANFANPSWIITKGLTVVEPIEKFLNNTKEYALDMIGALFLAAVLYFLIILAFFIMAIQVFITYLEVYIVGTLAVIFLGCGVNKHTSFLAEKAIGSVLSFGIKLMTLAFILSIAEPTLNGIVVPPKPNTELYLQLFVSVSAIAFLCWQAPSLAAGLMAGSPSLTAGGVAGAVMAAGAAVSALAGAATMAGKALGGLSGSAGGASATMQAANAFSESSNANTTNLLTTSLNDGTLGPGSSSGGGDGGGMTAASVAEKVDPGSGQHGGSMDSSSVHGGDSAGQVSSTNDLPSGGGDEKGSTTGSATSSDPSSSSSEGQGGTSESNVPALKGNGSEGDPSSTSHEGTSSGNPAETSGTTTSSEGESGKSSSGIKASNVFSRMQSAIPPESSPQGGVGVTLQHDD